MLSHFKSSWVNKSHLKLFMTRTRLIGVKVRRSTSITGCVRRLVGRSVSQTFDYPQGAPTWPTWPTWPSWPWKCRLRQRSFGAYDCWFSFKHLSSADMHYERKAKDVTVVEPLATVKLFLSKPVHTVVVTRGSIFNFRNQLWFIKNRVYVIKS